MVYALTDKPRGEMIMAMDCSDDIKDKLIDVFRREYGTVHEFDKEYYVTSKGDLHMMDTMFRVVTKCRIERPTPSSASSPVDIL
jgi:hypothetical protein